MIVNADAANNIADVAGWSGAISQAILYQFAETQCHAYQSVLPLRRVKCRMMPGKISTVHDWQGFERRVAIRPRTARCHFPEIIDSYALHR